MIIATKNIIVVGKSPSVCMFIYFLKFPESPIVFWDQGKIFFSFSFLVPIGLSHLLMVRCSRSQSFLYLV